MKIRLRRDYRFVFERHILRQHRSQHEPEVMKTLKKIKGVHFVDIGANIGIFSMILCKNFQWVHAYEPNPACVKILSERLANKRISNVLVRQIALSDKSGGTPYYLYVPNTETSEGVCAGQNSIIRNFVYKPLWASDNGSQDTKFNTDRSVEVKTSTFDEEFPGVKNIELVKIDVEGAEFLVLKGMKQSIAQGIVDCLLIELHDRTRKLELESILQDYSQKWVDTDHLFAYQPRKSTAFQLGMLRKK